MKPLPLRVVNRFKHIGIILLVALTTYVTLGRLLMPLIAARKDTLELQLGTALGVPASIGDIKGSWFRFGPSLTIANLRIGDPATGAPLHTIERVEMVLDVPRSVLAWQPVVSRISAAKLAVTLNESEDGKWALAGLPRQNDGGSADPLIDFLLHTKILTVKEGTVVLQRKNGQPLTLSSVIFSVENGFSDHEAQLQVRIGEQPAPAHAVVKLNGDPRRSFNASLWLDTDQLDLLPLVQEQLPTDWRWQQLRGQGRFWMDVDSNGIQNFAAELNDMDVGALNKDKQHRLALQHGSLKLVARPVYGEANQTTEWNVRVQDLGFDWLDHTWSANKLQLLTSHTPGLQWRLQADAIDLEMVSHVLNAALPMPERAHEALDLLNARGFVRNVVIDTAPDGSYPQKFHLRGNLDRAAVDAWHQAPSGSGLDAYIEATANTGFAEVDSHDLTLHLPHLFNKPWHFDKVNARVSWHATADEVQVQSGIIDVENPALTGKVRFALDNTHPIPDQLSSEFSLQVGVTKMQVAAAPDFLPTLDSIHEPMNWLRESLQGGQINDSAFVMHSIVGAAVPEQAPFVGSWYRASGAELKFLSSWPPLQNATATVLQSNNRVDVLATGGTLAGIAISEAEARIRPTDTTQVLSVHATATTPTATGINFLRTTPLHDTLGSFLDDWQAKGEVAVNVGLGIDLHDHAKPPLIHVETDTRNSELDMQGYDLQFSKVAGHILFDTRTGLQSNALTSTLFDNPLKISMATTGAGTATQIIRMEGDGHVAATRLQQWSGQPVFVRELFNYTQGEADYKATLTVSKTPQKENREANLLIATDLVGLSSNLPMPLGKQKDMRAPLEVELGFGAQRTLEFRYRDLLTGSLQLDGGGIQRGMVSFGERNRNFNVRQTDNDAAGVLVSGDIEQLDVKAWQGIAAAMNKAGGQGRETKDYLRLVDVNIGKLMLWGDDFSKVNVLVKHPDAAYQITARNDLLAGSIELPDDAAKPVQVALEYLRLPAKPVVDKSVKNPPEEPDLLADIDPAKLPAIDFKTDELSEGPHKLGAYSFQLRPTAQGASISNFRMQAADARITDTTRSGGASLEWHYTDGKHQSSFTGLFAAGDLAKVLPLWGHDPIVVSKDASFDGTLQWPGSPLHFDLKHASGAMRININGGHYVDYDDGKARVLGALNFDALIRRLRLDFSDVFGKGFAFDRVDGALNFTDGVVNIPKALRVEGPSTKMDIQGELNLRDETIAVDIQMQIPIGQNLSMLVALFGAWPVALSTYAVSKFFHKQVDELTSVAYHIEGPWDNPTKVSMSLAEEEKVRLEKAKAEEEKANLEKAKTEK